MSRFCAFLGTFLLIFNTLHSQNADCVSALDVCKKQNYQFPFPKGEGNDNREADMMSCFINGDNHGQAEENSTWIKFEIAQNGTLGFIITPYYATDDIDFVVFRLPADGNCSGKQVVRCMAAGDSQNKANSSRCMGQTGLQDGETDSAEDAGCNDANDNAWLAPLRVVKGEKYVILVSNVSGPRGWQIDLTGTAKLPCEEEKPPVVIKDDKKKDDPKPPKKKDDLKPPIVAAKDIKPTQIGGRAVEVGEVVKVKSRKIKVKIWDSQIEDGDVVSIYIDDKKVLDHHRLRIKPEEFEFELPPTGKEHYLTVYADDFGKAEPNTATLTINDGVKEQRIDLVAGRKKQESVKILTEN